jgi:hypothetical protein
MRKAHQKLQAAYITKDSMISAAVPFPMRGMTLGAFFNGIAAQIARSLKPRKVCDAGCAKGFLVEAFWAVGIEAWSADISSYMQSPKSDQMCSLIVMSHH